MGGLRVPVRDRSPHRRPAQLDTATCVARGRRSPQRAELGAVDRQQRRTALSFLASQRKNRVGARPATGPAWSTAITNQVEVMRAARTILRQRRVLLGARRGSDEPRRALEDG